MNQEDKNMESQNPSTEIDFPKMEGQLRIVLQKILESLSSIIQKEEEKIEIEKLIHDYGSLDELLKIILKTLDVLMKKFFEIIESQKSFEDTTPQSIQQEYLTLEKQLQKFEQESREHIRVYKSFLFENSYQNEQQLQIYSDTLFQKIEDLEKKIQVQTLEQDVVVKKKEGQIDELQNENQRLINQINSLTNQQKQLIYQIEELQANKSSHQQTFQELEEKLRKQDLLLQNFLPLKDHTKPFPQSSTTKNHSMQLLSKRTINTKSHLNLQQHKLQDYSATEQIDRKAGSKFNENKLSLNQQIYNETNNNSLSRQQTLNQKNSFSMIHSTERRNQTEVQLQQYIGSQLPINPKFYNTKTQSLFTGQKNNVPISLMTQNQFIKSKPSNSSLNYSQNQRDKQNLPHVKDQIQKIFRNTSHKKRNLAKQQPNINLGAMIKSNEFL